MENKVPTYLLQREKDHFKHIKGNTIKISFLDKTLVNTSIAVKSIYIQAENASKQGLLQKLNPHVKLISLVYIAIIISLVNTPDKQLFISVFIFTLYFIGRLKILQVYKRIFFLAFIFGILVVLPASLNLITPGKIILNLFSLKNSVHFWIYNIPQNIGITGNGLKVIILIFLRVLNSVSVALLIVFTTSFPSFIKSFRILGVPDTFMMIISLAYKYIFILSRTIEETYFALKSRLSGNVNNSKVRELISGRIFFIFKKSMIFYESTYYAMVSRGYKGKVILLTQKKLAVADFIALSIVAVLGILILYF